MKHRSPRRARRWLKRHLASISIITVLIIGAATGNWLLLSHSHAAQQKQAAEQASLIAKMDTVIRDIKARKAAEEKTRQEAEAKATADAVIATPEGSANTIDAATCNVTKQRTDPTSIEVMVNKKHCLQPLTYAPADLVTVYGATLSSKAAEGFKRLYEAAQVAGVPLHATSSYRSYSTQVSTYQHWVATSGAAGADTYSARPGYSEHQTGFALDLASASGCSLDCFGSTPHYQWLQAHAADYGFIQRYYAGYESITGYKAEEWHYRYVGEAIAKDMKAKGVKTLEQYWNMPGGTY
jgi:zinc D-Ala-D-Ala carboxypeptidase